MFQSGSATLEQTLALDDIHEQWDQNYRTPECLEYLERALDRLVPLLAIQPGALVLDAGCGAGVNSIRIANRGFRVEAVDFSDAVLQTARKSVESAGLSEQVHLRQENLLALRFPDESFDATFCWGVLMHIAEVDQALSELSRVLKPGGKLVVSEINMRSLQRICFVTLTRLLRRSRAPETRTPAGMECWFQTSAGPLLRRHTDIRWLVDALEARGLRLVARHPGQFTELYLKARSRRVKAWIQRFNIFWVRFVRIPHPAFGNILVFEKSGDGMVSPTGFEPVSPA